MASKAPVAPTNDIDRAERDLATHGYALIADDMDGPQMAAIIDRFSEQAIAEARLRGQDLSIDDEFLRIDLGGLLNKGRIFLSLLDVASPVHQVCDRAMTRSVPEEISRLHGLEQHFILSSMDGTLKRREDKPGGGDGRHNHLNPIFHIDQGFMPVHTAMPVALNCFHCLTDYTYGNGATMVVPGTQNTPPPSSRKDFTGEGAIPIEVPAGTCIVMDGRTWHAAGVNTNGELRGSITTYYGAPWFRQRWPMALNLRQEVIDELTDAQLKLCGFDTMYQSEYGSFAGPNIIEPWLGRSNVTTKQKAIGELHLN